MAIVRAPVRISFGGGGTDLAAYYTRFGGFVVSAAISRYCYVIARRARDHSIRVNSADYQICESFGPGQIPSVEEPLILPKAAIERFASSSSLVDRGVDLFLAAEVPPGTGLGSSSAMAVALSQALATYLGSPLSSESAAETACRLEIERLGMPIGKQDQYASACGGINTLEFTSEGVTVTPLDLPDATAQELSSRLLLFATGRSRHSAGILREQRAATRTKGIVVESLHRLKALAREMATALRAGELDHFGHLLDQAWQYKKQLSGKISDASIDAWYNAARSAGALGGKIAGAGGGGFLLLYCPPRAQAAVRAEMVRFGLREYPFDFDFEGVRVLSASGDGRGRSLVARYYGADESRDFLRLDDEMPVEILALDAARGSL